ncbi:MAG: acyltransferase [Endozoicomonas sp.]
MSEKKEPVLYLDLLRTIAAIAVVIIHVLGPYRYLYGETDSTDWLTAIAYNSVSRWCVPVFIMITGMLFLSDQRPFNFHYFVRRRVGKVLLPFLLWSVIYALLSGQGADLSYDWLTAWDTLKNLPYKNTWYHLGFYYYFIPLYFLIPFLKPVVEAVSEDKLKFMIVIWLWLTVSYLMGINSFWHQDLFLYGGYLLWGYSLAKWDLRKWQPLIIAGGVIGLSLTFVGVYWLSMQKGEYSFGRFNSYKTVNTVLVATMVFCLVKHYANRISGRAQQAVSFVSRYSLGLFLVHPLLLWPVRAYDLYWGHAALAIPFWTVINTLATLLLVWLMARRSVTRWMVP